MPDLALGRIPRLGTLHRMRRFLGLFCAMIMLLAALSTASARPTALPDDMSTWDQPEQQEPTEPPDDPPQPDPPGEAEVVRPTLPSWGEVVGREDAIGADDGSGSNPQSATSASCLRNITAEVVALDQPFYLNRLGAINANGMIYALARDVVTTQQVGTIPAGTVVADVALTDRDGLEGRVALRADKRPRPIVLRMNEGDCLAIRFTNLLDPNGFIFNLPGDFPTGQILGLGVPINPQVDNQPLTRVASIHIDGLALVGDMSSDGSNVGQNDAAENGLVDPGASTTYTYYAAHEATHLLYSMGTTVGGEGAGGTRAYGLFGAINVQKPGAEWYRSQLTREEMDWATPPEVYTDWSGNGVWDDNIPEPFIDDWNGNGTYEANYPEPFVDYNGNDTWDPGEPFTDWDGDGVWDASLTDTYTDWDGDSVWDASVDEPLVDTNGDGVYDAHRTTPGGQPILDYDAVYPAGAPYGKAGLPIVKMLTPSGELVHSDLNAIITGPGRGNFPPGTYRPNQAHGDPPGATDSVRNEPYREFTVVFHDEGFAVQAFPAFFNDPVLGHAMHGVSDGFPINYGSGGIGSEIVANRLGVGPMWDCTECKFEEFFLSSFTVGDPAMIVDIPANTTDSSGNIIPGAKATKALYPDDPSNVHHSYLNDRVRFRNLHAGPKEHHIFHLHAHQWLFNSDDTQSGYHDSQAIGPGGAHSYEIAYGGSGNRNKTPGDSIFHCHFYPHFAQGMWELWRVHDTFEQGTLMDIDPLDGLPVPASGSRALPDGEIVAGTPIPGVVPIPTNAMAPMPDPDATIVGHDLNSDGTEDSSQFDANGDGVADIFQIGDPLVDLDSNPGYPWFIPGLTGHRPTTPAFDMDPDMDGLSVGFDGGLPRHVVTSGPEEDNPAHAGSPVESYVSRLDFNKVVHEAAAIQIPEDGTVAEQVAMDFHAQQYHATYSPQLDPTTGMPVGRSFETNGLAPQAGAPYADPCRAFSGAGPWTLDYPNGAMRTIKAANIEMPVTINKVGWHFQQQRFQTLWEDAVPTLTNAKAPEPLVMRLNSTDCAEFHHTNLVPNVYQLDDFQVRTPTDIIGQHIHLVKFDVTSSDGAANGWNYEDGTLSPDEVRERIDAFNNGGGFTRLDGSVTTTLAPEAHPFFGATGPNGQNWLGARTTIQRWYADPLLERSWDGGVGTVFTHDHYGPSTHQQVGLYSTLLVEPQGSVWRHNETGAILGTRSDGGPTTWQAVIEPGGGSGDANFKAHREFFFEFADFQHAYEAGGGALGTIDNENLLGPSVTIPSYADFDDAINPSFRLAPPNLADLFFHPNGCPGPGPDEVNLTRPCPEVIDADDPGTYILNLRNEPLGLRVFNGVLGVGAGQSPGLAGDLANVFQSRTDRSIAALNSQPAGPYPPLTADLKPGDPWTPMMRVYMGDPVRIRVQVGAQEEEHNFTIPGLRWRESPNSPNSGWRNSIFTGISEYFNLDVPIVPDTSSTPGTVDYVYLAGAETEGLWNGVWGLLRSYSHQRADLYELSSNDVGRNGYTITNEADFNGICPQSAPLVTFEVTAARAIDILGPEGIIYNSRTTTVTGPPGGITGVGPLIDPTALMYVLTDDIHPLTGKLRPGVAVEPLIMRVNAGDCVEVNLTNALPPDLGATEMPGFNSLPPIVHKDEDADGIGGITSFNANDLTPSSYVGLTPQLLAFDPRIDGGFSSGLTSGKLIAPGSSGKYTWYAGDVTVDNVGVQGNRTRFTLSARPVEFGAVGLMPADLIKGSENGLVGAVVVEPQDSCWITDLGTRAQATVWKGAVDAGGDGMVGPCASTPDDATDSFRDYVTVMQNDINLRYGGTVQFIDHNGTPGATVDCAADPSPMACAVPNIAAEGPLGPPEDPQDSAQKAINYGADPLWFRLGISPSTAFDDIHRDSGLAGLIPDVFSNFLPGVNGDPQTEVFRASPLGPTYGRVRVVMPGGHARGVTYTLHGHEWQREPFVCRDSSGNETGDPTQCVAGSGSSAIGHNPLSFYYGAQDGVNPSGHWNFVTRLGGYFNVQGDYLWRDQGAFGSFQGLWGLLRFDFTPPLAPDATRSVVKYQSFDIDLLGQTFDLDHDAGVVAISDDPEFGRLTDKGGGKYTYTSTDWPACGDPLACTDSFTYTVTDDRGLVSNVGTVIITVTNTAPVANHDTIVIKAPDTSGSVDLLGNDVDAEGDLAVARTPVVTLLGQPVDRDGNPVGTISDAVLSGDRTLIYTPPSGFAGVVLISYSVTDESGAVSNVAMVRAAVNVDDITITQATYQPINGMWTIKGTCTDPYLPGGSTPTTITIFFGPTIEGDPPMTSPPPPVIGTATCMVDSPVGTWSFSGQSADPGNTTPDPTEANYVSAESALQGFYEGFPVTFAGQNNPPVAHDDPFVIDEDTVLDDNVLTNDSDADFDPLTAVLVSGPSYGMLILNPDGSFTYTPAANYNGADQFTYRADDSKALSNVATVSITIDAVNDAPSAVDDGYTMDQGANLTVAAPGVLGNDSDVEGDVFTLDTTPVSGPASGNTLTLDPDGSFSYSPDPLFTGVDNFVYRICEDLGGPAEHCGQAEVTISVGINDAPVAVNDNYVGVHNQTLTVNPPGVLGNDSDTDGDSLSVVSVNGAPANVGTQITLPSGATLTVENDGRFTYTPLFNYTGTDSFTYAAGDGTVASNTATVTITVRDIVKITKATYFTRQAKWKIDGTVSVPTSSVDVYLHSIAPANLIGTANVDDIDGSWSFQGSSSLVPVSGDKVIAVSSGGGESAPVPVNVRR